MSTTLRIVPITLGAANTLVWHYHRHHRPVVGHKFSLGVVDDTGLLRGAVIVGRPVARMLDDGRACEVTRLVTDGYANACSALYGAARRVARAMGYEAILTYTLASESGTSLHAAGWVCMGGAGGGSWSVPSRPRRDRHPLERKTRWEVRFTAASDDPGASYRLPDTCAPVGQSSLFTEQEMVAG